MLYLYQGINGAFTEGGIWEYIGDDPNAPAAPLSWDGGIDETALAQGVPYEYRYTVEAPCGKTHSSVVTVYKTVEVPYENDDCSNAKLLFFFDQTTAFKNREKNRGSCVLQSGESYLQLPPTLEDNGVFAGAHDIWYRVTVPKRNDGNEYELLVTIDGEAYSGAGISHIAAAGYTGKCSNLNEVGSGTTSSQKLIFSNDLGLLVTSQLFFLRVGCTGTLDPKGRTGNEGWFNLTLKLQTI